MNKLLTQTLETIKIEQRNFNKSFDLVEDLLNEFGEDDLANRLYSEIDKTIAWEIVANLYGILAWSISDNNLDALIKTTEGWITECNDERKIAIALNLDVFPFLDEEEMRSKLEKVGIKFPSLKAQCHSLIETRLMQHS